MLITALFKLAVCSCLAGAQALRSASILRPMLDFEISPQDVAARLQADPSSLVLLDVREPWELAKARITGSAAIPVGEIPSRAFQELDPESHIIAICHSGVRSMNVTIWLRNQGFENVQSLRGGIDAWSREVDPQLPRY
jgi:rhodanese-related sulfurtransferase